MPRIWKSAIATASLAILGLLIFRHFQTPKKPLGEGPVVTFPSTEVSSAMIEQFLADDFTIIKEVKALPLPVLGAFTEQSGLRFTIADPGKKFLATDVIYDSSLPRKRLIFAGTSGDKCFVHYEQGGLGHTYLIAFFTITDENKLEPLWLKYCGPASDFHDLRSRVLKGECSVTPAYGIR